MTHDYDLYNAWAVWLRPIVHLSFSNLSNPSTLR